jgi:hypothetical protein
MKKYFLLLFFLINTAGAAPIIIQQQQFQRQAPPPIDLPFTVESIIPIAPEQIPGRDRCLQFLDERSCRPTHSQQIQPSIWEWIILVRNTKAFDPSQSPAVKKIPHPA